MAAKKTTNKDNSAARLAEYMKKNKADHLNFEKEVYWTSSTGSLLFDMEMGGGYNPGVIKTHGASFAGKSSSTAEGVKNFLSTVSNSKAIWIKSEGRLDQKFRERSGVKFVFDAEEWVEGTCFVMETNVFEFAVDWLVDMVTNNPAQIKYAIVIDSIDALIKRDDLKKSASESEKVAAAGVILSAMFKRTGLPINKLGHIMFAIHQVRAKPKISKFDKGNPNETVGGGGANATTHASNFVIEFKPRFKSNNIEEGGKVVGHWCHVNATKGVDEKVSVDIKYPIKHGRKNGSSIWVEYEIKDLLLQWEMIIKKGSWLNLSEGLIQELNESGLNVESGFKVQGEAGIIAWLEENPDITKHLYNKFLKLLST
jgi:RecA/RadA recombinase